MAKDSSVWHLLRKGQRLTALIASLAPGGDGVSRDLGLPIFVSRVAPGDLVELELFDVRKDFARGRVVRVLEPSSQRQEPPCKLFKVCGGCQWQHLAYEWQLKAKEAIVRQSVKHIGGLDPDLVLPAIGAAASLHYRNKVQFPVSSPPGSDRILAGYYQQDSHQLVNVKHCPVQPEPLDRLLAAVKEICQRYGVAAYDERKRTGLLRHINARYSFDSRQVLVTLVLNCPEPVLPECEPDFIRGLPSPDRDDSDLLPPDRLSKERSRPRSWPARAGGSPAGSLPAPSMAAMRRLADELMAKLPELSGVCLNFNTSPGNRILGQSTLLIAGQPFVVERLRTARPDLPQRLQEGLLFCLGPTSFFQVNSAQAVTLLEVVLDAVLTESARPEPDSDWGDEERSQSRLPLIVDAYAGVGTIALWLSVVAQTVIAVEEHAAAVLDGLRNLQMNKICNVDFRQGTVEQELAKLSVERLSPATLLLDPPRKGVSAEALQSAVRLGAQRIVYVSCNPATLARDLKILEENGYKTKQIQPIDLFPQTFHVESVTVLDRT